jgi:hypothetical protein
MPKTFRETAENVYFSALLIAICILATTVVSHFVNYSECGTHRSPSLR